MTDDIDRIMDDYEAGLPRIDLWECFGCIPRTRGDTPITRLAKPDVPTDSHDDRTGITQMRIEISTYGDEPTGAFIQVRCSSREAVTEHFQRITDAMPALLETIWNTTKTG